MYKLHEETSDYMSSRECVIGIIKIAMDIENF